MAEPQRQNNPIDAVDGDRLPAPPISFLTKIFATALFSGYVPAASGTAGSLVGLAFYLLPGFENPFFLVPAILFVLFLGGFAAGKMEKVYGRDPSIVTIDEVMGMWVSLVFLPKTLPIVVASFLVFRAFDIIKPWPARFFDRRSGGWNIMLDDLVAGIYANMILQLAVRLL